MPHFYIDMDGVLVKYDENGYKGDLPPFMDPLKHYFLNLNPDIKMLNVTKRLIKAKYPLDILTTVSNVGSIALVQIEDKIEWLHKYLPDLDTDKHFIAAMCDKRNIAEAIKFSQSHTHINGRILTLDDVIIDDWNDNLNGFADAGGTSIKYLNGINSKSDKFNGIHLDLSMTEDQIFKLLTKHINYISNERKDSDED